jgi:hypothetical protein
MKDTIQYYELYAGRYTYFVSITTKYSLSSRPISHGIDIGGKMKGCIRSTVEVPNQDLMKDERFAFMEQTKNQAFISWIGYNKKCTVKDNLISGDGTRHMLRTAMTFIVNKYTWIDSFTLLDESNTMCDNVPVRLSRLSLALHGKTYYEKYLKADLQDETQRSLYKVSVKRFSDPKNKLPFKRFVDVFPITEPIANAIKDTYESSDTYMEFFQQLRKKYRDTFCSLISPWLNPFIDSQINSNVWFQKWVIKKETIKSIPVESQILAEPFVTNAQEIIQEEFKPYYSQAGGRHISSELGPLDI